MKSNKANIIKEALAESEDRLQFVFLGSGDGMWDWNVVTGEVNYSKQWKAMLGYNEVEIIGDFKEWENRVHPDDLQAALADIQGYLMGATPAYANEHRLCSARRQLQVDPHARHGANPWP
jgi:PAS domain-containing protein